MQYFSPNILFAMLFAFIGCSIRYSELYKLNKFAWSHYIVDSLIAMCLGYITYLELTIEFEISLVHTYLVCIIIGNVGSKVLTLVKTFLIQKLAKTHDIDLSQIQIKEDNHDSLNNPNNKLPKE